MTTLYRPVLITSAGQAEALPIGTIAQWGAVAAVRVPESTHGWPWVSRGLGWYHDSAVGWMALVPIEAEEETTTHFCTPGCREGDYCTGPMSRNTRLVTPWEAL